MMYSLWSAAKNEHYSARAGKVVGSDQYKQVGQYDTQQKAHEAFLKALANSAPGTKIKLIGTVPEPVMAPVDEIAKLKARIKELGGVA